MNQNRFDRFQRAVSDKFLEEAYCKPAKKVNMVRFVGPIAACIAVAIGLVAWKPWQLNAMDSAEAAAAAVDTAVVPETTEEDSSANEVYTMVANPIQQSSAEEFMSLGFTVSLPNGAENPTYLLIDGSLAEVDFSLDSVSYTYRTQKTDEELDISGIYSTTDPVTWKANGLSLMLVEDSEYSYFNWYEPSSGIQYSLSSDGDSDPLLYTALGIARDLGHTLGTAPEGAEVISINAFAEDSRIVAETVYRLNGILYTYRTAPGELELEDISGLTGDYTDGVDTTVGYCPAAACWNEGGTGKIIWFDIVPGLLYSLAMESGATENALTSAAEQIFVPAQGDVG